MVSPPAQSGALRKYYYGILYKGLSPKSIPPNFFNLYVKVIPDSFSYPLIEESDEIVADKRFGEVKPILALLRNGELFKVIEMVYSTDIPAKKENYYRENEIDVIRIHLARFSQAERIQKTRDYLPLTFVSVTVNRDREIMEKACLLDSEYEIEPHFENYFKMIGTPERIREIIKTRETIEDDEFDEETFMELQDRMIDMPEEEMDKMRDLATQIRDLCSEIEKNAEENGLDPDEFSLLFNNSPSMIDLSANLFIHELDEYKQMKKES